MIFSKFLRLLCLPFLLTGAVAQSGPKGGGPLQAEVHHVKSAPFAQTLSTVGTLRANESVTLVSELSRLIAKIHVQEGSEVNAGDLLFKLDDSDLQAELAQIEAQIKLAEITKARAASLLPEDAISQQEYDSAFSAHHLLQAQKNTQ